jgi:hypothetical protein
MVLSCSGGSQLRLTSPPELLVFLQAASALSATIATPLHIEVVRRPVIVSLGENL